MTAVEAFLLPDLGEGLTEATVVEWLVQVGDHVSVDQAVARVETAKAVTELPTPIAGVVVERHADPGATVAVGAPLVSVRVEDHDAPGGRREAPREEQEAQRERHEAPAEASASGGLLVGSGIKAEPPAGRHRRRRPAPASWGPAPPVVSPMVRRLAREHGVDLATLQGTGPGGVILRGDVEAATGTPGVEDRPGGAGGPRRVPVTGVGRAMAEAVTRSRREIPEATVWVDVDATPFLEAKAELGSGVSVVALLARFCVAGLARHPELNASFDAGRTEVLRHPWVHLGIAAQTPRGLVVPVVHHAERRTTVGLAQEIRRLVAGAQEGTLPPEDLAGGTFTVNNYGIYGVDGSAAVINHPEAGLLGLGRIADRPWVVGGQLAVRKVTQLTLAFDHRVCDGGVAGSFLRFVADCVENPVAALAFL